MKLRTFKIGGIHPDDNKLSATDEIINAEIPKTVTVPLSQHLGAPAKPLVKKGDNVKVGTKIGEAAGFISSNIHSPVSGTVQKVEKVIDTSGYKRDAIIIDVEGDEWEESIDRSEGLISEITKTQKEIVDLVKEHGIVGLGGATFPTFVKLMVPPDKKVNTLVINAVECEPYLTCDHRIMMEKPHEIMIGCQIVMKALGIDKTVIGIENNKPDAIKYLKEIAGNYPGITIQGLKVQYPQGGEKQLINAVLGVDVPSGKIPLEVGAVVMNVGTTVAIYESVQKNKPLIDRVLTITGKDVTKPVNIRARIGHPMSELIELAGGIPESTKKIINGGPMMGKALTTIDIPMTKGTSGILLMKEDESKRGKETNCIRCGKCTTVCPMGLEPFLLAKLSKYSKFELSIDEHIMDCIECGSCSYICPANKALLDNIRAAKSEAGKILSSRSK